MTDKRPDDEYVEAVRQKAARMARARKERRSVWVVLGQAGTVGWQFALPLVACTLAGHALSRALHHRGPALAGVLVGLALGLWQAGRSLMAGLPQDEEAP
ncbi:MAG: AtpZ/AtpI family protein [Alphaproteobacteria bacterium]|nr:AtpZ/AtpI family protein [Alphaproteobacteria bacterium]MCB9791114.1 AtpZ/AtpI family protein [Alphaproteobacteria bacterium]